MKSLLRLLYCIEILGALLCGANDTIQAPDGGMNTSSTSPPASATPELTVPNVTNSKLETSSFMSAQSPTTTTKSSNTRSTSPPCGPQPTNPASILNFRECPELFMISGGLVLLCTILLISTLMLACKVCHLSSHIKALSSNAELISSSEYWMGNAKKSENKSETEAKETSILMSDVSQTQQEVGNGTNEEEEGKSNQEGQMEEENKKETKETVNSEEASTTPETVAEDSSASKPQEDPANAESTNTEAASCSEGQEKTDVV